MNLDTLISSNAVISNSEIKSKKRALERLAEHLAAEANQFKQDAEKNNPAEDEPEDDVDPLEIFQLLTEREKLGSTAMGHGVALPHARTDLTDHAIGAFLRVDKGIDFDSPDQQATDLIFALLVPQHYTDEHLQILAYLASLFSDEEFCQSMRKATGHKELYDLLVNWQLTSQAS